VKKLLTVLTCTHDVLLMEIMEAVFEVKYVGYDGS
jgi:hypothetical protein